MALKLQKFHMSLPLKRPLVTTLSEIHSLTSRKYVAGDTKSNLEQFKFDELFWFHFSVFALEF